MNEKPERSCAAPGGIENNMVLRSSFGEKFKVTIFGGSHEPEIGCVIEGLNEDLADGIDLERLTAFLKRRAPGSGSYVTSRKEPDIPEIVSRDPLTIVIKNRDVRPGDYSEFSRIPRPGHADYTARIKYGNSICMSGGGPFSGRMTAPLCAAGGIALQILERAGVTVTAHLLSVGPARDNVPKGAYTGDADLNGIRMKSFPVFDDAAGEEMKRVIMDAAADGDSVGGIVELFVIGCPAGLGGPMYDGIESVMAPVFFGIPAVKGVEFGAGSCAAYNRGSENNDPFVINNGMILTETNNAGGILGGITNGMPLVARISFKPTPSISRPQRSVDIDEMRPATIAIKGRHDPCVAVRAVPAAEAAAAAALLDIMMKEGKI